MTRGYAVVTDIGVRNGSKGAAVRLATATGSSADCSTSRSSGYASYRQEKVLWATVSVHSHVRSIPI